MTLGFKCFCLIHPASCSLDQTWFRNCTKDSEWKMSLMIANTWLIRLYQFTIVQPRKPKPNRKDNAKPE